MAEFREYQQREQLPGHGPEPGLRPLQAAPTPAAVDLGGADRAMSEFGKELSQVAAKVKTGQQNTLVSQAIEGFLGQNADLKNKYSESSDFLGAEAGFRDEIDNAKKELLADISDPALRASTSLQMERLAIASQGQVRAVQIAKEKKANDASLQAVKTAAIATAVSASSHAERGAAIDMFDGEVGRLAHAGWIDGDTAGRHIAEFANKVDQGDATNAIKADPGMAIALLHDDGMFPALDPAQRGKFFEAAYRAEWMEDRVANSGVSSEALDRLVKGQLTPEWLASNRDAMPGSRLDSFARATEAPAAANPDPAVHAALLRQAIVDPEMATFDAVTAYGSGSLDRAGLAHVVATAHGVAADSAARPWVNDVRKDLAGLVAQRPGQDEASASRQAAALPAFETWLAENPDTTRAEAQARAAGFAAEGLVDAARFDVSTMPLPHMISTPRTDLDLGAVRETAGRMHALRARGGMSDDDFINQAELLGRWNDALLQIGKAAP